MSPKRWCGGQWGVTPGDTGDSSSDSVSGFKFSRASYLLSLLRPQIYTELELKVEPPPCSLMVLGGSSTFPTIYLW